MQHELSISTSSQSHQIKSTHLLPINPPKPPKRLPQPRILKIMITKHLHTPLLPILILTRRTTYFQLCQIRLPIHRLNLPMITQRVKLRYLLPFSSSSTFPAGEHHPGDGVCRFQTKVPCTCRGVRCAEKGDVEVDVWLGWNLWEG